METIAASGQGRVQLLISPTAGAVIGSTGSIFAMSGIKLGSALSMATEGGATHVSGVVSDPGTGQPLSAFDNTLAITHDASDVYCPNEKTDIGGGRVESSLDGSIQGAIPSTSPGSNSTFILTPVQYTSRE